MRERKEAHRGLRSYLGLPWHCVQTDHKAIVQLGAMSPGKVDEPPPPYTLLLTLAVGEIFYKKCYCGKSHVTLFDAKPLTQKFLEIASPYPEPLCPVMLYLHIII